MHLSNCAFTEALVVELKAAKDQIRDLNEALEKLLMSKADVEDAVHRVSRENQALLVELRSIKAQSRQFSTGSLPEHHGHCASSSSSRDSSFSAPCRVSDAKHQPGISCDQPKGDLQVITDCEHLTPREPLAVVESQPQPSAVPSARRKRLSSSNLSDTLGASLSQHSSVTKFIHPLSPPAVNQRGPTSFREN